MRWLYLCFLLTSLHTYSFANENLEDFKSEYFQDSMLLFISTNPNHSPIPIPKAGPDSLRSIHLYFDANIKFGKKYRDEITEYYKKNPWSHDVFVGVDFHEFSSNKRRDAFIPTFNERDSIYSSPMDSFLMFELMPKINSNYKSKGWLSVTGHSLSGLYVVHLLCKHDTLFDYFLALSPSLWVNNYQILDRVKAYNTHEFNKILYVSYGGLEVFNRIKMGIKKLQRQKPNKVELSVHAVDWRGHNGSVQLGLKGAFGLFKK